MTIHHKRTYESSARGEVPVPMTIFIARLIYFVFGAIITFILLRIILLMLSANDNNGIVSFVYSVSNVFVAPFHNMFNYTPAYGSFVFEPSSLVAIIVYSFVMWGLVSLVTLGTREVREEDI